MRLLLAMLVALALALLPAAVLAVNPDEMLSDPKLEARAEAIGSQLRCLVCQNESIEASGADLAHDLRLLVRQRVKAGDTDRQVIDYIVSRYGEYVLLRPRFEAKTLVLWLAAPALLAIGGAVLVAVGRKRSAMPARPQGMDAEAAAALEAFEDEAGRPAP